MQPSKRVEVWILLVFSTLTRSLAMNDIESSLNYADEDDSADSRSAYSTDGQYCESIIDRGFPPGVYRSDEALLTKMGLKSGVFEVYCEKSDGVGWTVIQTRKQQDPRLNFTRTWDDYAKGFGNVSNEFWMGNEWIHKLTTSFGPYKLRIELMEKNGKTVWAEYSEFKLLSAKESYRILVSGHSGNVRDSLSRHNNVPFVTLDHRIPTDVEDGCIQFYKGGWWYLKYAIGTCINTNLNSNGRVLWWRTDARIVDAFHGSKMMIRSKQYRSSNKKQNEN